jgi:hypothetical protein
MRSTLSDNGQQIFLEKIQLALIYSEILAEQGS